jgi:hypothetical protein
LGWISDFQINPTWISMLLDTGKSGYQKLKNWLANYVWALLVLFFFLAKILFFEKGIFCH